MGSRARVLRPAQIGRGAGAEHGEGTSRLEVCSLWPTPAGATATIAALL